MNLSIVIPIYNEEENIPVLYEEIDKVLGSLGVQWEVVFVDDGSSDKSYQVLSELHQQNPQRIKVISFRRNFGQTAAMSAGFDHSEGDVIITMDGDLQNDPADIPVLLDELDRGYDLVSGWRFDRKDKMISRRIPSMIANWLISVITGVKLHDYGCTLKAFRREITDNIHLYGEMHRFIPAIASAIGVKISEIKVNHRPRRFGSSKYGISRTIRVILDLITVKFLLSYATRPIQIFGLIGTFSGMLGFIIAVIMTIQRQFYDIPMANRPLLQLAILLIFLGIQFVTLGLLGEVQARTYHETQKKPIYTIRHYLTHKTTNEEK